MLPRVVVIGGGFGGLHAVQSLADMSVQVTLVDRRNFHLFQPLLYQVATGGLSPANIAAPLRSIFRRRKNVEVLLAEVVDFDVTEQKVILQDGELPYDYLIIAAGSRPSYFGHDAWQHTAPGLKSIEDATEIRRRVLLAFEEAERTVDPDARRELMTFVVVGGGPTGVEMAGALAEIARHTLRNDFRRIDPRETQIVLLDGGDAVLSAYPAELSHYAALSLADLGVQVHTKALVTNISADRVEFKTAHGPQTLAARTVIWAAGVQASPLGQILAAATGAPVDRAGRVVVTPDCSLPEHPEIFVIGDMANYSYDTGHPLPGVAPVAMQQGAYVARVIERRLEDQPSPPFHYVDRGSMATIGRSSAIAEIGRVKLTGLIAWLLWLFIHLMALVRFENRLLVLSQWFWYYITFNRTARLITGEVTPFFGSDLAHAPPTSSEEVVSIGANPELDGEEGATAGLPSSAD